MPQKKLPTTGALKLPDVVQPTPYRDRPETYRDQYNTVTVYMTDEELRQQVIELSHRVYDLEQDNETFKGERDTYRGLFLIVGLLCLVGVMVNLGVAQQTRSEFIRPSVQRSY